MHRLRHLFFLFYIGQDICAVFFHRAAYERCDKPISVSCYCLYKARLFGVIFQDQTNLADGSPDAVVGIKKCALAPNPGDDFIASDDLAWAFDQQSQDFERDSFHLQHMTAPTQPAGKDIKLEIFAEPDRFLHFGWLRNHWHTSDRSVGILYQFAALI